MIVDLRSDTVTRPTPGMRQAMAYAEVGDDVFGEDPTVNQLEQTAAELFGKEAGLFVPSATMANQIAIGIHTHPGDEVIAGKYAHSYLYEVGGAAALSGVQITVVGTTGLFTAADALPELRPPNIHHSVSSLIMIENTHNRGGGRVFPLQDIQALSALARSRGMALHMDGARVFNACLSADIAPKVYGGLVDTLCFCLSKGLGAPVGSMLVGSRQHMTQARRLRKRFGGGMRQVGILAAAGLYALEHHISRLAEDHARAQRLTAHLQTLRGVRFEYLPETNIVIFVVERPDMDAPGLCRLMAEKGVKLMPFDDRQVRAVLHLDITDAQLEYTEQVLSQVLGAR